MGLIDEIWRKPEAKRREKREGERTFPKLGKKAVNKKNSYLNAKRGERDTPGGGERESDRRSEGRRRGKKWDGRDVKKPGEKRIQKKGGERAASSKTMSDWPPRRSRE